MTVVADSWWLMYTKARRHLATNYFLTGCYLIMGRTVNDKLVNNFENRIKSKSSEKALTKFKRPKIALNSNFLS
jgi:hypothetical protein